MTKRPLAILPPPLLPTPIDRPRPLVSQSAALHLVLGQMHSLQISHTKLQVQVKEMRRAYELLEASHDRYQDLYESAPVGYLTLGMQTITHINRTGAQLLLADRDHLLRHRFSRYIVASDRARFARLLKQVRSHGGGGRLDVELQRGDGTTLHAQLDCVAMQSGLRPAVRVTLIDITERKRAEVEIRQLAFYDPLTCLPNRRLLLERLQRATAFCARSGRHGAVVFVDLDDFKSLNDSRGHAMGDLLLEQVASRLMACAGPHDTVGRLGGDEFVVLLEGLDEDLGSATRAAIASSKKILTHLAELYLLNDIEYRGTASVGLTIFSDDTVNTGGLLSHADVALYRAKAAGRGTLCCFDVKLQQEYGEY